VFAGDEKSFQKFVVLLPAPATLVVTVKFFRKETLADVVTLIRKAIVLFISLLPKMLKVMFVSNPSCMRVGEIDNEYAGAAEVGGIP
jgi:hypothetical protein